MEVPLFGLGLQGKSPNITANKLINAYYEFHQIPDRTKVSIHGTPGLSLFLDRGATPWRGLHELTTNSKLYGVHRSTFYEINNSGVSTSIGTLNTDAGQVCMSDDGTYVVLVDGTDIYTYNTSTSTFAVVSDPDRPINPSTCAFQGGRILTDEDGTGQFKGSDLYDPTSWDALNFATAESNPDKLIRPINFRGSIVLFGSYTTEFWSNVGGSGFPYARILNADLEYGLAARWSVAKFAGSWAFLAKNREGQVIVCQLEGYNIKKISNTELDHIINNYSDIGDATAFGYMLGGHPFYQVNFPSAGKSWLYDGSTDYWSELRYKGNERHRAAFGTEYINRTIVADYDNGKLYTLDPDYLTDDGENIHMILRGRHIFSNKNMMKFTRLELGIEPGVGGNQGAVAGLRLSRDGGNTFGTQIFARMGKVGEYLNRCIWRRLGIGRDFVPEITITDPVKRIITDSVLHLEEGR